MKGPWEGRVSPSKYFLGGFALALTPYIIGLILLAIVGGNNPNATIPHGVVIIPFILYIPALFYIWCLIIRRCHDLGWSGWLSLIVIIPFVGWIFALVLLFKSSDPNTNKYGAPLAGRSFLAEVFNY